VLPLGRVPEQHVARYPGKRDVGQNAAQIPTSFGGLVYMMASVTLLALVIMLEAPAVATSWSPRD